VEVRDAGTKLENAIDWGARPYCQNAWSGKPGPLRPVFDGARTAVLRWTGRKRNREDHGIGAIMSIRAVKRIIESKLPLVSRLSRARPLVERHGTGNASRI